MATRLSPTRADTPNLPVSAYLSPYQREDARIRMEEALLLIGIVRNITGRLKRVPHLFQAAPAAA